MSQPVPPDALHSLAALSSKTPGPDRFGLTILPLRLGNPPSRSPPSPCFSELDPPQPNSLIVANTSARMIVMPLGRLVLGGMADRALTAALTLPPGAAGIVPVEPLAARWWPAGGPRSAGRLPPALVALLILATHAGAGLRSVSRTALWEGYRRRRPAEDGASPANWVLLRGRNVLAAHLLGRVENLWMVPATPEAIPPPIHAVPPEGEGGDVVRLVHAHEDGFEVWWVRATWQLPTAVLGDAAG